MLKVRHTAEDIITFYSQKNFFHKSFESWSIAKIRLAEFKFISQNASFSRYESQKFLPLRYLDND